MIKKIDLGIDVFHFVVFAYMISGFFISTEEHGLYRFIHGNFCISVLCMQVFLSMRCPLVVLQGYLKKLDDPDYEVGRYAEPFVVKFAQRAFGLKVPAILIMVASVIIGGMGFFTVISMSYS